MRWNVLAIPLVLLIDIITFINFSNWLVAERAEFEERQFDLQVNYAVDAAAYNMLLSGKHIETSYSDWGSMVLDPEIALDTYEKVLLINFDWSTSEANIGFLETDAIPFFCVATYDGYYMFQKQPYEYSAKVGDEVVKPGNAYKLVPTMKIPYSYENSKTTENGATKAYYAFHLDHNQYFKTEVNDKGDVKGEPKIRFINKKDLTDSTKAREEGRFDEIDENLIRDVISTRLSTALTNALLLGSGGTRNDTIYIPGRSTTWTQENSVEGPTVFTYLMTNNGLSTNDIDVFAVAGTRIDDADFCFCYGVNGDKRYTYAARKKDVINEYRLDENDPNFKIFTNPNDAAEAGYSFDLKYAKTGKD